MLPSLKMLFNLLKNKLKDFVAFFLEVLRRAKQHRIDDLAAIIAYYTLWASVPLSGAMLYLSTYILGSSEKIINDLNLFSQEFLAKINPRFFFNMKIYARSIKEIGLLGIYLAVFLGTLLVSKIIQSIQIIYGCKYSRSFFWRKLKEFAILISAGFILILSFALIAGITTLNTIIEANQQIAAYINPSFISSINNFLIKNAFPFLLSFLFFFGLYKWIPERKVSTRAAFKSAILSSFLWQIATSILVWYVSHISKAGKVYGTLSTVIIFIFWVEISSLVMLFGAEIASLLNERRELETKANS